MIVLIFTIIIIYVIDISSSFHGVVIRKSQVQHGALYDHLAQQGRPHGRQEHLDHGGPGTVVELRSLKGEKPRENPEITLKTMGTW
jgi:hypothetical protein